MSGLLVLLACDVGDTEGEASFDFLPCVEDEDIALPPPSFEWMDAPCAGNVTHVRIWPEKGTPEHFAVVDSGTCLELSEEAGVVHLFDAESLSLDAAIPWPEANEGGGVFEFGDPADLVFALSRSNGRSALANDLELYRVETGAMVGFIEGEGARHPVAWSVEFVDDTLLTGNNWDDLVYAFEAPWRLDMTPADAIAIHEAPCDGCEFGSIIESLGDVTGDGIADAVFQGEYGLLFVDGEYLRVDGGARSAGVDVYAPAYVVERTIAPLGDFDGDGLDDYVSLGETSEYGATGAAWLLAGGASDPFASIYGDPRWDGTNIGEVVGPVGDVDGDGLPELVLLEEAPTGSSSEAIWHVEGPIRCGDWAVEEVGTRITWEESISGGWFGSSDGLIVLPSWNEETDVDALQIIRF